MQLGIAEWFHKKWNEFKENTPNFKDTIIGKLTGVIDSIKEWWNSNDFDFEDVILFIKEWGGRIWNWCIDIWNMIVDSYDKLRAAIYKHFDYEIKFELGKISTNSMVNIAEIEKEKELHKQEKRKKQISKGLGLETPERPKDQISLTNGEFKPPEGND